MQDSSESYHQSPQVRLLILRILAFWLDLVLIYLVVWLMTEAGFLLGLYLPFELTFILVFVVASTVTLAKTGSTAGKYLLGLAVMTRQYRELSLPRILLREWVGKALSLLTLCLFIVLSFMVLRFIASTFSIRSDPIFLTLLAILTVLFLLLQGRSAVHDWVAGTMTAQARRPRAVLGVALSLSALSLASVVGSLAGECVRFSQVSRQVTFPVQYSLPMDNREPTDLTDFRDLDTERHRELGQWLTQHSHAPLQFVVEKANAHSILIFGEQHEQRQALEFLHTLIPVLRREGRLTQVVMETLFAPYNREIHQVVTASTFDPDRVLELFRRIDDDGWGVWGFQEYLDVFRVVWEENQRIPPGKANIRLIGMAPPVDARSLAMVGIEDNSAVQVPIWEKLRLFRLMADLPAANWRDEYMAHQVEQVMNPGSTTIVWVGAAHSMINCAMPGRPRATRGRLGFILSKRHPGEVAQIVLHQNYGDNTGESSLSHFIEETLSQTPHSRAGFEISGGPLELIRDSENPFFRDDRIGWGDVAQNYILLDRLENIKKCRWIPGYITENMFVRNKPFYQSWARHFGSEAESAADVNRVFSAAYR